MCASRLFRAHAAVADEARQVATSRYLVVIPFMWPDRAEAGTEDETCSLAVRGRLAKAIVGVHFALYASTILNQSQD